MADNIVGYDVLIERVSDGERRMHHVDSDWDEDVDWSWWATGNESCDCNRELAFERVAGVTLQPGDPRIQCSDGRFRVLTFILPDGTHIVGPDA